MPVQRFALVLAALSLGAAACSDPVSPPAQAAIAIQKRSVSDCFQIADNTLSEPEGTEAFIAIMNQSTPPPDDIRIVDGEGGATVSCDVSGSGTFRGNLRTSRTSFVVTDGQASGDTGTALITQWDHVSQETLTGSCTLGIKSLRGGAVWASFDCPMFNAPPTINCAGSGVLIFENCGE